MKDEVKLYVVNNKKEYEWITEKLNRKGIIWESGDKLTEYFPSFAEPLDYQFSLVIQGGDAQIGTLGIAKEYDKESTSVSDLMERERLNQMASYDCENEKPTGKSIELDANKISTLNIDDPRLRGSDWDTRTITPDHYRRGEIDRIEGWYKQLPFSEFKSVVRALAERYLWRDKNDTIEDLNKAIYTIRRLKGYVEKEKQND